jgi:hypothetical protein
MNDNEFKLVGKLKFVNFMCSPPKIEIELSPNFNYTEFQKFLIQYGLGVPSIDVHLTTITAEAINK